MARDLARSNAHLEEFASMAAHDLQSPLRTITMLVSQLCHHNREHFDEKSTDCVKRVEGAARRMQTMIVDLLTLCQFRKNQKIFGEVDVNLVFDRVTADLLAAISECGGSVIRGDLPRLSGDEGQLRQLMQNLIANAIKFRRPEAAPQVLVTATDDRTHWTFCVADNGIGIEEKYFDRIFQPFQRLHGRMEYPGNGIGLAVCKVVAERHNGAIRIESRPGEGSKFYFSIAKDASY
jgi:light-regulated signal transduction histidine kinase (bacteriophytochrome)